MRGIKEARKWILRTLTKNYPQSLSVEFVAEVLQQLQLEVSLAEVEGHLAYLEEKGYVATEEVRLRDVGLRRKMARIRAKGIDLVDKLIPADPGVAE